MNTMSGMRNDPTPALGNEVDSYGISIQLLQTIADTSRRVLQISDIAITKRTPQEQEELDQISRWWRDSHQLIVNALTNRPFYALKSALESVEPYLNQIGEALTLSTVEVFPDNTGADFWSREQLAISLSKIGVLQARVSSLYTVTYAQAALIRDLINETNDALDFANSDVRGTERSKAGIGRVVGMSDAELSDALENAKAFLAGHAGLLALKNSLEHQFQIVSRILSALHERQS